MTDTAADKRREKLTVIVPCFNEEDLVETTVNEVIRVAPKLPMDLSIYLVDDGSTDGTRAKMEELCAKHPECTLRVNESNLGLGRSVLDAYEVLAADSWASVIPGDSEVVAASLVQFAEVRDQYDVILGYVRNTVIRTLWRRLASYAFMKFVQTLYGFPYRYLNGLKMYKVGSFKGIQVISRGHAFNAELLAKAILRNAELRVGEVPFVLRGRARGTSKALRSGSVLRAIGEVFAGHRSVAEYRRAVIREGGGCRNGE